MTEAEWLTCNDPTALIVQTRGEVSDRKLRLLALACCQRIRHLITAHELLTILDLAERLCEGLATNADRREAALRKFDPQIPGAKAVECTVGHRMYIIAGQGALYSATTLASSRLPRQTQNGVTCHLWRKAFEDERVQQAMLAHDIIGNPFRPVSIIPSWLTSTVVGLAGAIYQEKTFDRLPILADALEEAGCDNADVLTHLRGDGPHVRGCWALDLILGKT